MPHKKSRSRKQAESQKISAKIRKLKKEGKPQKRAVAQAINTIRRSGRKKS